MRYLGTCSSHDRSFVRAVDTRFLLIGEAGACSRCRGLLHRDSRGGRAMTGTLRWVAPVRWLGTLKAGCPKVQSLLYLAVAIMLRSHRHERAQGVRTALPSYCRPSSS